MKGSSHWNYRPYMPIDRYIRRNSPCITRMAPAARSCELSWINLGDPDKTCLLYCRQRGSNKSAITFEVYASRILIPDLRPHTEYEVCISYADDPVFCSDLRLFRTSDIEGTVVNYLHPLDQAYSFSGSYLCSPSIVRTPSGRLLTSMDVYGMGTPQNLSFVYYSDDNGLTWDYLTSLFPCFWGKLFVHDNRIYMLALTGEYGNLVIGYSDDDGLTWSNAITLFPGSGIRDEKGMHQAPTPVILHNGRLWTAVDYGSWNLGGHSSAIISIDASKDLMNAENWVCSEFVPFDPQWPGTVEGSLWGCLEGNAVAGPDGTVYNMLRYQISDVRNKPKSPDSPTNGKALLLKMNPDDPEKPLAFHKFIDFNGGMSKFHVLYDEISGRYISLVNRVLDDSTPAQRNVLALAVSEDLENWHIVKNILDYSDESPNEVAYQYVSFLFDGKDILFVSRTAYNHAFNYHNTNYITFHRIQDFRSLL